MVLRGLTWDSLISLSQATSSFSTSATFFSVSIRTIKTTATGLTSTETYSDASYITPLPYVYAGKAIHQDPGIPIAWQASDLAKMTPASAVLQQPPTSTPSASVRNSPSAPTHSMLSHGLSQGTQIGLGVGLGVDYSSCYYLAHSSGCGDARERSE